MFVEKLKLKMFKFKGPENILMNQLSKLMFFCFSLVTVHQSHTQIRQQPENIIINKTIINAAQKDRN